MPQPSWQQQQQPVLELEPDLQGKRYQQQGQHLHQHLDQRQH
jgi:hypothetical protein